MHNLKPAVIMKHGQVYSLFGTIAENIKPVLWKDY